MSNYDCFPPVCTTLHLSTLGPICCFYHPDIHTCIILLRIFLVGSNFMLSAGCYHLPISPFPHYLWVVWIVLCTAQMPGKLYGKSPL